ncbi:hypothetical protein ACP70R_001903 [Stipagrostis hirtigluma subsp. patula]
MGALRATVLRLATGSPRTGWRRLAAGMGCPRTGSRHGGVHAPAVRPTQGGAMGAPGATALRLAGGMPRRLCWRHRGVRACCAQRRRFQYGATALPPAVSRALLLGVA